MRRHHEIPARGLAHRVTVGWDNALMTFFAQVTHVRAADDSRDAVLLRLGDTACRHRTPESLAPALAAYAALTPAILHQLRRDRAAERDRAATPLQPPRTRAFA